MREYIYQLDLNTTGAIFSLSEKGGFMDPKLVKQFISFLILLFAWTIVILIAGPK
jgi:hypothetical protein